MNDAPGGIGFHISRAKAEMGSEVTELMLKTTEELYYALYASLNIEITNVDICDSYLFDIRKKAGAEKRDKLPEQSHLGLMFRACKEVLRSEDICELLDREIIRQHQANYVRWAIEKSAREGYYPKDQLGYRQYILRLVAHPESPALLRWYGLIPERKLAPATALTVLTERYMVILKKERADQEGKVNQRDSTTSIEERKTYETVRTMANREAASAMLNGITVGEFRRIQGALPLREYAANMKCICFNFCICAKECTKKASRPCPCSGRMSRVCANQEIEPQTAFEERYGDLTEAVFEGLCVTRRGETVEHMAAELKTGLDLFHQEVIDFRREHIKMSLK